MCTLVYVWVVCAATVAAGEGLEKRYTNSWVAEIHGGEEAAQRVSRTLGFTYNGQASHFENHYELTRDDQPELSEYHSDHLTRDLLEFDEVKWAKQQKVVERSVGLTERPQQQCWDRLYEKALEINLMQFLQETKEENNLKPSGIDSSFFSSLRFPSNIMEFLRSIGDVGVKNLGFFSTRPLDGSFLKDSKGVTKHLGMKSNKVSAYALRFNDPNWRKQWYVQDYRTHNMPVMDHNVVPVYNMGITGATIRVAVLDDGVQHNHPDLAANMDITLSYDMCLDKPGALPVRKKPPGAWSSKTDPHGTKCAGVIAMVANNKKCGVGIAYGAKVSGVRMLCPQSSTEYKEAKALSHAYERFDIYSSSWTPPNNGYDWCKLDHMVIEAFIKGTTQGRKGKGAVYVHSAGNGKELGNFCAANCYINHPYGIAITSATQFGKAAYYSDRCTAIFATAYSGARGLEGLTTLNADGGCRSSFSGTSAATALAAGIFALVLESNRDLTYRDVMHLITMTAEVAPLADDPSNYWYKNGRGLWVSNDFGFGLLNAENMVLLARKWQTVPEKRTCTFKHTLEKPVTFFTENKDKFEPTEISVDTDACRNSGSNAVSYLEHLEVMVDVSYPARGALGLMIISPEGTPSVLLEPRPMDYVSPDGLRGWNIMSVHNWGEDPKGEWNIFVFAVAVYNNPVGEGTISEVTLTFHGTNEKPEHYNSPRVYSAFRLETGETSLS